MKRPQIAVILSGCGVYDGSEIHEAVLTLYHLQKQGAEVRCFAPNVDQHHVINHLDGQEMQESRNVLVEAARIARGEIEDLSTLDVVELDGVMLPGGFGVAKNLTKWAFEGPNGDILDSVKEAIQAFQKAQKPIGAVCMAPTTVAKALEGQDIVPSITIGTTEDPSPYNIEEIGQGIAQTGAKATMKSVTEVEVDEANKIVTSPAYMMQANMLEVSESIENTVKELLKLL